MFCRTAVIVTLLRSKWKQHWDRVANRTAYFVVRARHWCTYGPLKECMLHWQHLYARSDSMKAYAQRRHSCVLHWVHINRLSLNRLTFISGLAGKRQQVKSTQNICPLWHGKLIGPWCEQRSSKESLSIDAMLVIVACHTLLARCLLTGCKWS